jgi:hypothetical protein
VGQVESFLHHMLEALQAGVHQNTLPKHGVRQNILPKKTESIRILFLTMELKLHTGIPGEQPFLLFYLQLMQICCVFVLRSI